MPSPAQRRGIGNRKESGYERDPHDWYVESEECVRSFLMAMRGRFDGPIHDPCCGLGMIPCIATAMGLKATGSDLVDRMSGKYPVRDFLVDNTHRANIVVNPPFSHAEAMIRHALAVVRSGGIVAALAQIKFLASQTRHPLFTMREMERVFVLSTRPSMPPGKLLLEKGEHIRGSGFHDFVWLVWRVGKRQPGARVEWLL